MHAVGSIIDIEGGKFVVCGYRPYDNEGTVGMGYLLVPYPLGFVNLDSFSLVPSDADYPLVHEGFCNEDGEQYDRLLEQVRRYGSETSPEELLAAAGEVWAQVESELAAAAGEA